MIAIVRAMVVPCDGMAGNETEFGGVDTPTGVQPPPHVPTPSEQLMLIYRTGDPSGLSPVDKNGDIWAGLRSEATQREKAPQPTIGQEAQDLASQADQIIEELAQEAGDQ